MSAPISAFPISAFCFAAARFQRFRCSLLPQCFQLFSFFFPPIANTAPFLLSRLSQQRTRPCRTHTRSVARWTRLLRLRANFPLSGTGPLQIRTHSHRRWTDSPQSWPHSHPRCTRPCGRRAASGGSLVGQPARGAGQSGECAHSISRRTSPSRTAIHEKLLRLRKFSGPPHPARGHPLPSSDEGRGQGEGSALGEQLSTRPLVAVPPRWGQTGASFR